MTTKSIPERFFEVAMLLRQNRRRGNPPYDWTETVVNSWVKISKNNPLLHSRCLELQREFCTKKESVA